MDSISSRTASSSSGEFEICFLQIKISENEKEEKCHGFERRYGKFSRSFRLPDECVSRIGESDASSKNRVIEIPCPKENNPTQLE
jgi:HSP20 family molecular chaperone IbpA